MINEFKVGDRVRQITSMAIFVCPKKELIGTVISIADSLSLPILVKWDNAECLFGHFTSNGYSAEPTIYPKITKEETMKEIYFQIGDKVSVCGRKGIVTSIPTLNDSYEYPVSIKYDDSNSYDHFTTDGRFHTKHTEPSLRLIERPKKIPSQVKDLLKQAIELLELEDLK